MVYRQPWQLWVGVLQSRTPLRAERNSSSAVLILKHLNLLRFMDDESLARTDLQVWRSSRYKASMRSQTTGAQRACYSCDVPVSEAACG
jgi:hypothetical protein